MEEIGNEIIRDLTTLDHFVNWIEGIHWGFYSIFFLFTFLVIVFIRDVRNKRQTIKHNFPVVGHIRYLLEKIGPELRQYIVANNREELPFNRSQRSWIYASSKRENNYEGFGTDKDLFNPGHIFINPSLFPYRIEEGHVNFDDPYFLPCAKVMGLRHNRKRPFRPYSMINISAMSFGSLSAQAVTALNKGAQMVGCYHNTGEGGLSLYHSHGADVMFHFGTNYFGCRTEEGNFSMEKLIQIVEEKPFVRAIEVKLSQGAKPGKGGVLPAAKITPEIAEIRGVKMGEDVISPPFHKTFKTIDELIDFIEKIAEATGLPVGIKSAVGKMQMWKELADKMAARNQGPDFITIDGGEGGTGAAPHSFADHVSLPFVYGFKNIYQLFAEKGIAEDIFFIASGKLGFPADALKAVAMGADSIHVAREAMMSIGCIQAQVCHTNTCPAGVATQKKWLASGLDPAHKSVRFYNYIRTFRKEMLEITHACGYEHPCQVGMEDVDVSMGDNNQTHTLKEAFGYDKVKVAFDGMESLKACQYLGAQPKQNMAKA